MNRKCFAKINLTLDSLAKRPDGYHEIDSIMARISLFDELRISKNNNNNFNLTTNETTLLDEKENLIYKAWELLKNTVEDNGIDAHLEKNIPIAAGLGGGSSDAAEMIKGLNELWDLGLSKEDMQVYGAQLGADIPFFFEEKTARARGIGEVLSPFDNKLDMKILLVNDGTAISSAQIYKNLADYGKVETDLVVEKLENADPSAIFHFENAMEDEVMKYFPHLADIKADLLSNGAEIALISGSGASIFAIFKDDHSLDIAYNNLKGKYEFVEKVELIDG